MPLPRAFAADKPCRKADHYLDFDRDETRSVQELVCNSVGVTFPLNWMTILAEEGIVTTWNRARVRTGLCRMSAA